MPVKKKAPAVTLGKTEGPDGERSASILLDGVEIGTLETWKQINFRPAKHIDFSHVYVMLWEPYDYEGTFDADTYGDANTARRAALDAVRVYLAARPVKAPTPAPVVVPVVVPAPPRIHTLTTTTWMITDESRPFAARYAGTDSISGLPFEAGAEVRSATVNGVKGYVSTAGVRLLDVRYAADGRSTSVYTIVTPAVDTDALVARAQRIRLLKKQGGYVEYALTPYGWVSTRTRSTLAQLNRYARVAYAIFAEGRA